MTPIEKYLLFAIVAAEVYLGLTQVSDLALAWDYIGYNGFVVPYSVLWTWMNPFYWTQIPYRIFLVTCCLLMLKIQHMLYKRGKLSFDWMLYSQLQNCIWFMLHWTENITVTLFAPLASIFPPFVLLEVLQKLPLGWSWDFNDPHVHCAFGNLFNPYTRLDSTVSCLAPRLNPEYGTFWTYIALAFWLIVPVWYYYRKNKNLRRHLVLIKKGVMWEAGLWYNIGKFYYGIGRGTVRWFRGQRKKPMQCKRCSKCGYVHLFEGSPCGPLYPPEEST